MKFKRVFYAQDGYLIKKTPFNKRSGRIQSLVIAGYKQFDYTHDIQSVFRLRISMLIRMFNLFSREKKQDGE